MFQAKTFKIINQLTLSNPIFNLLPHSAEAGVIRKSMNNLGLVGYWTLNEGTGNFATDSSGNGNNGTLTGGPSWVDGKRGKALNFDGTDDYIQTTSDELKTANNFTVALWFKADTTASMRHLVWQGDALGNGGGAEEEFGITVGDTTTGNIDQLCFFMEATNDDINTCVSKGTDPTFTNTGWNFLVATITDLDTTTTSGTTYLNGVLYDIDTGDTVTRTNWNTDLRIGSSANGRLFDGNLDDVRIYNRALSPRMK